MRTIRDMRGSFFVCWTSGRLSMVFEDHYKTFETYEKALKFYDEIWNLDSTWVVHITKPIKSTDYAISA